MVNNNIGDLEQGKFVEQNAHSPSTVRVTSVNNLIKIEHDQVDLTYVTSGNGVGEIETVTYKLATVTVATLTLSYDINNNLISVVKS